MILKTKHTHCKHSIKNHYVIRTNFIQLQGKKDELDSVYNIQVFIKLNDSFCFLKYCFITKSINTLKGQ